MTEPATGAAVRRRPWGPWSSLGIVAGSIVMALVLATVGFIVLFTTAIVASGSPGGGPMMASPMFEMLNFAFSIAIQLLVVGTLLLLIHLRGLPLRPYLGLRPTTLKAVGFCVLTVVGWMAIEWWLHWLVDPPVSQSLIDMFSAPAALPIIAVLVVVIAPIAEEIAFRGFLWRGLIHSRLGLHGTVAVTTVIFALLHAFQYGWFELLLVGGLGAILGYSRHLSRSLLVPMLIHFLNNLVAMAMLSFLYFSGELIPSEPAPYPASLGRLSDVLLGALHSCGG